MNFLEGLRVLVKETEPVDHIVIVSYDLFALFTLDHVEVSFCFDKVFGCWNLFLEYRFDCSDFLLHLLSKISLDIISNVSKHHSDKFFAIVDEPVVKVFALHQKHAHSDLKRHVVFDFINSVLILLDFLKELFFFVGLNFQEFCEDIFLAS